MPDNDTARIATLDQDRQAAADALFQDVDFDCRVEDFDGWERHQPGDVWSRKVYFASKEHHDITVAGSFEVTFFPGSAKVKKYHGLSHRGDLLVRWDSEEMLSRVQMWGRVFRRGQVDAGQHVSGIEMEACGNSHFTKNELTRPSVRQGPKP